MIAHKILLFMTKYDVIIQIVFYIKKISFLKNVSNQN